MDFVEVIWILSINTQSAKSRVSTTHIFLPAFRGNVTLLPFIWWALKIIKTYAYVCVLATFQGKYHACLTSIIIVCRVGTEHKRGPEFLYLRSKKMSRVHGEYAYSVPAVKHYYAIFFIASLCKHELFNLLLILQVLSLKNLKAKHSTILFIDCIQSTST